MNLSQFIAINFLKDEKKVLPQYTEEQINKEYIELLNNGKLLRFKEGDIFCGRITTTIKEAGVKKRINRQFGVYRVKNVYAKLELEDFLGQIYKTSESGIRIAKSIEYDAIKEYLAQCDKVAKDYEYKKYLEENEKNSISFDSLRPKDKLAKLIDIGQKNIWMVGAAGSGKSTITRNCAIEKELPYLCISCGIGTSAAEFIGYKYPERTATRFSEFYSKPSIILIDEITALDPAVGQVLNAALANDEIETTTGLVHRHPECIIVATSNTFGFGADRQYVANNQLDASTIDRFVGGIIEVTYSEEYETQYDSEVVEYVNTLRKFTSETGIRKVLSTRLIQAGHRLKFGLIKDWKNQLICNWSKNEQLQLEEWSKSNKLTKIIKIDLFKSAV
jgi:hypothetical protein